MQGPDFPYCWNGAGIIIDSLAARPGLRNPVMNSLRLLVAASMLGLSLPVVAAADADVATFKSTKGAVSVLRAGQTLPASTGMRLLQADTVLTGTDGAAGISFSDQSLVSLGADSRLLIDKFQFDPASGAGQFESTLSQGRMAVVSGKIAKHQIDAMKVRTPTALLGIRGTEFVVDADQ